jgi:hypothetical protein
MYNADMAQAIKTGLESEGFKPEVQPLNFFQDDYGLKLDDGEEEPGDDDDNDEFNEEFEEEYGKQ